MLRGSRPVDYRTIISLPKKQTNHIPASSNPFCSCNNSQHKGLKPRTRHINAVASDLLHQQALLRHGSAILKYSSPMIDHSSSCDYGVHRWKYLAYRYMAFGSMVRMHSDISSFYGGCKNKIDLRKMRKKEKRILNSFWNNDM